MDRFKKNFGGNRGGGFNSGGGRPDFRNGGRDRDRKEMFDAVCANCHKSCKIPFRPMTDKPVYCSDCFGAKQGGSSKGNFDRRNDRNSRPSFEKRDFSSSTVPAQSQINDKRIDEIKKDLESLNFKLDKVMQLLSDSKTIKPVENKQAEKKLVDIKKATAKKVVSSDKKTTKKIVTKKKVVSKKK